MNDTPRDPLSNEERELATMLSRLGPHGEPSAALDACILAASRAAAAPRRGKPSWPVALGLAASLVGAVGIAWQLRPVQPAMMASEVPMEESAAPVENAAPGQPDAALAATAGAEAENRSSAAAAPEPAAAAAPPRTGADVPAAPASQERSPAGPLPQAGRRPSPTRIPQPPAPPAPMPPASAAPPRPPGADAAPAEAFVADAAQAPLAEPAASDAAADRTSPTLREQDSARADPSPRPQAEAARAKEATAKREALEQVTVTGSRVRRTDLQVPVAHDAQLKADDWLERVRTRYGLGDEAAARQSLLLFVQDHPDAPVPDDLQPLLDE